ncbi:hypothetical protein ElyMa_006305100 [Elysia marginata]|uniref:Prokineticin domain-containing protein n=1 Tax=Elysia marginata TaxID=1093978 RepID=A0AAV4HFR9_9GAST|nr:hypothetical protein ElyMa_006305100 [Elysia marginata]
MVSPTYQQAPAQFLVGSNSHADECSSDADCMTSTGENCCMKVRDDTSGSKYFKCMPHGMPGSVCDLDGQAEDACPCQSGLTCSKIDLTEFGPTAASVNVIFEKYHFGMCEAPVDQAR